MIDLLKCSRSASSKIALFRSVLAAEGENADDDGGGGVYSKYGEDDDDDDGDGGWSCLLEVHDVYGRILL